MQSIELVNALVSRLGKDGVLVIVEIEDIQYGSANPSFEAMLDGRKEMGNGSREFVAGLKETGIVDIAGIKDQDFSIFGESSRQKRRMHKKYYMVRATKVTDRED